MNKHLGIMTRIAAAFLMTIVTVGCTNATNASQSATSSTTKPPVTGFMTENTSTTQSEPVIADDTSISSNVSTTINPMTTQGFNGSTTTEPEDMNTLKNEDVIMLVGENIDNAESFIMTCEIMGCIPGTNGALTDLIEHKYVYTVNNETAHLVSTYRDLNKDPEPLTYEEYQYRDKRILTTVTRNGNAWIDNTPKTMSRDTVIYTSLRSIGLLRFLSTEYTFRQDDSVNTADITVMENGDLVMKMPTWSDWITSDSTLATNGFAGLIRFPDKASKLHNEAFAYCKDGNAVYTFDKNYNLKNITADIYTGEYGYDLHIEINFGNWNNVPEIIVPNYTTAPIGAVIE